MRIVVLCLCALLPASLCAQTTSFHVGNSLTYDGLGNETNDFFGLEAIAAQAGITLEAANHVDNSQPLFSIWNDPNGVGENGVDDTVDPYGKYLNALPNFEWDRVVLQPHFSGGSTLGSDKSSIQSFIDLTHQNQANSDTDFYIYQTWPRQQIWPYLSEWAAPVVNVNSSSTEMRREYFDHLMGWVEQTYKFSGTRVRMIPAGEVFYELAKLIDSGSLQGVVLEDFWRDEIHMDLDLGRYVAATTIFATMFGTDPRGMSPPSAFFDPNAFQIGLVETINETIWSVVTSSRYTGLADFNDDYYVDSIDLALWEAGNGDTDGDGLTTGLDFLNWQIQYTGDPLDADFNDNLKIDTNDLALWESAYGLTDVGDANLDGRSDGLDFLIWQEQLRHRVSPPTSIASVPEPNTVFLLVAFIANLVFTRKI